MKSPNRIIITLSACGALLLAAAGCSTPTGVKTADTAGSSLAALEKQLETSRSQIAEVMTALNDLTKGDVDVKSELNKFSKAVASLKKTTDADAQGMLKTEAAINSYLETWGNDIAAMSSEELKQQSTTRRQSVITAFDAAKRAFSEVSAAYEPFQSHLNDLVTYLSADLSPAGISAAQSMITDLKTEGANVQRSIQSAAEKFSALRTSLGR